MIKIILHYLAWVIIIGNLLLLGLVGWWLWYPYQLPNVEQPIEINNPENKIAIGEVISMTLRVSKPVSLVSRSQPNITCEDGNLVTLSNSSKTLPVGEYVLKSDNYILPPKVNVGAVCKFNFVNTYQVNPIRTEIIIWSSELFTVSPKN